MSPTTIHKNSYLTPANQARSLSQCSLTRCYHNCSTTVQYRYMYVCWPLSMQSHVQIYMYIYIHVLSPYMGVAKWREALCSTNMLSVTTRRVPTKNTSIHNTPRHDVRCTTRQSDIITMSTSTLPCQRDQNNTRRVCVTDAYSLHHHHTHTHTRHTHT